MEEPVKWARETVEAQKKAGAAGHRSDGEMLAEDVVSEYAEGWRDGQAARLVVCQKKGFSR